MDDSQQEYENTVKQLFNQTSAKADCLPRKSIKNERFSLSVSLVHLCVCVCVGVCFSVYGFVWQYSFAFLICENVCIR